MTTPVNPGITEGDVRTALEMQSPIEFTLNVGDYAWMPDGGMAQGPATIRYSRTEDPNKIATEVVA